MSSRHRAHAEQKQTAAGRRAQRRRRTRQSALAGVLAGSLAIGGVAFAATRESGDPYRTTTAETAAVAQTVDAVGTIASASRADAAFSVAGTVATVEVAVGDSVEAGGVLATLDPTSLEDALDQAESTLADAEQQLEDDLESQTATTSPRRTRRRRAPPSARRVRPRRDRHDDRDDDRDDAVRSRYGHGWGGRSCGHRCDRCSRAGAGRAARAVRRGRGGACDEPDEPRGVADGVRVVPSRRRR